MKCVRKPKQPASRIRRFLRHRSLLFGIGGVLPYQPSSTSPCWKHLSTHTPRATDNCLIPLVLQKAAWCSPIQGEGTSRPPEGAPNGHPKTLTIRRDAVDNWYACFSCIVDSKPLPPTDKVVGVDAGLTHFATLSKGEQIANPASFAK